MFALWWLGFTGEHIAIGGINLALRNWFVPVLKSEEVILTDGPRKLGAQRIKESCFGFVNLILRQV